MERPDRLLVLSMQSERRDSIFLAFRDASAQADHAQNLRFRHQPTLDQKIQNFFLWTVFAVNP